MNSIPLARSAIRGREAQPWSPFDEDQLPRYRRRLSEDQTSPRTLGRKDRGFFPTC
jgi:hypothetical protein